MGGFGSQFVGFDTVIVDPGSSWSWTGANTVGNGVFLAVFGSLSDTGALTHDGSIVVNGGHLSLQAVAASANQDGAIGLSSSAVVEFHAAVSSADSSPSSTRPTRRCYYAAGQFSGLISGFVAGDLIDFAFTPATALSYSGNSSFGTLAGKRRHDRRRQSEIPGQLSHRRLHPDFGRAWRHRARRKRRPDGHADAAGQYGGDENTRIALGGIAVGAAPDPNDASSPRRSPSATAS